MEQDHLDFPSCSLALDDTLPGIVVRWKGYATSGEFRAVHEGLLEFIEARQIRKVLGDDTALASIASEDRLWILENWMPRAVNAGLVAAAAKRSSSYFARVVTSEIENAVAAKIQIKLFDTLAEARAWLLAV